MSMSSRVYQFKTIVVGNDGQRVVAMKKLLIIRGLGGLFSPEGKPGADRYRH